MNYTTGTKDLAGKAAAMDTETKAQFYRTLRHTELQWARMFRKQGKDKARRDAVLSALEARNIYHSLLAEMLDPSLDWLETEKQVAAAYGELDLRQDEHADWLDEQATRESVRP